ncbi:APC family permease [Rhodococcus koreensis]|uniref:APC family permease n=1 Tax=Rhodococcus koreensis TaxID=99653 RepID=UPI00366BF609
MTTSPPVNTDEVSHVTQSRPDRLPRRLGAPALTLIFVAFSAPLGIMAGYQQLVIAFGNGIGAPLASIVAGVLLLLFEVGCIAMSKHMKSPGAFYCYIAEGMGKPAGLAGAFLALIAYITITVGGYPYMGLITVNLMDQLFGSSPIPWQYWGLIVLGIVTVLNILRIDLSMRVLGTIVVIETTVVAIWQAVVFVKGGSEGYSASSFTWNTFTSGSVGLAILFSLASLIGLESTAVFREETRNPEKTVPRATYAAITFMSVFYGTGIWAYIIAVGPSNAHDDARNNPVGSFFDSVQNYMGGFFSTMVSVLLVTSIVAAINSTQSAAARYFYTLGRDRVLSPRLARVHPRLGSPYIAVLTTAAICLVIYLLVVTLSSDVVAAYGALAGFGTICVLPLLLGTSLSVIIFFRRNPGHVGIWKSWISPVLAFIGIAVTMALAVKHMDTMVGSKTGGYVADALLVLIIVVGVVVALRYKIRHPEVYRRIGRQDLDLEDDPR